MWLASLVLYTRDMRTCDELEKVFRYTIVPERALLGLRMGAVYSGWGALVAGSGAISFLGSRGQQAIIAL